MKKLKKDNLFNLQAVVIFSGVFWAWYNVIKEFKIFYLYENRIFKFVDCTITNPILTPCFWGACAFLIAFILSLIVLKKSGTAKIKLQKALKLLTLAGTLFAWGVVSFESYKYFSTKMQPIQTCTGYVQNPLYSSCFVGAIIFTLSLILASKLTKKH